MFGQARTVSLKQKRHGGGETRDVLRSSTRLQSSSESRLIRENIIGWRTILTNSESNTWARRHTSSNRLLYFYWPMVGGFLDEFVTFPLGRPYPGSLVTDESELFLSI